MTGTVRCLRLYSLLLSAAVVVLSERVSGCLFNETSGATVCSEMASPKELKNTLESGIIVHKKLQLLDSRLNSLPRMKIDLSKITALTIGNCQLPFLAPPVTYDQDEGSPFLQGLSKMAFLEIYGVSYLHAWDWSEVSSKKLTTLKITNCRFVDIPESFSKLTKLQTLIIESSELHWIGPQVFKKLTELSYVSLTDNKIRKIEDDLFSECEDLRKLDLSNNYLKDLPAKLFSTTELYELKLSGNPLVYLDAQTFNGVVIGLKELHLSDTLLPCDCSYKWLLGKGINPEGNCTHESSSQTENYFAFLGSCESKIKSAQNPEALFKKVSQV